MCGIVGFTRDPTHPVNADFAQLRNMLGPIAHRGPDESGMHVHEGIAFGHLRLAIVDLSGGHQPRVDERTGDALIFNGELYNFRQHAAALEAAGVHLADRSDTEVLFALLRRDGVERTVAQIDGMFAFAFYEGRTGRLHLARDRFGEKPLYWLARDGKLVFGSEPRAVLSHGLAQALPLDPAAISTFLLFEYLPGSRSLKRGLNKLPPGHVLTWDKGRSSLFCYWRPNPEERGTESATEAEKLDRLDQLLDDAVQARLIADVPVGVFLSGGIDSSLIAALVAKHASGLTAFTVQMADASFDETPAARALAQRLGLRHEIVALDANELRDGLATIAARLDEPLADSSLLPTWVLCRAARRQVTVALGGDGADELFAGYMPFKANRGARLLSALPGWTGRALRSALALAPHSGSYMSLDFLLRQLSNGFGIEPSRQWVACMAPFHPEELDALCLQLQTGRDADDPLAELLAARDPRKWSTAELIYLFATTYLPEDILQKVDRASMYVSLEVRSPFLARDFAEYALALPSRDKLRGFSTKHLFRKLALRHIPHETVMRKKHGFALPLAGLLRGPFRELVGATLLDPTCPLNEFLDRREIERLWSAHQAGHDHRKKLWSLFTLATAIRNLDTAAPVVCH
jgi:asparagine synthase (glutamine-hydrolysing)